MMLPLLGVGVGGVGVGGVGVGGDGRGEGEGDGVWVLYHSMVRQDEINDEQRGRVTEYGKTALHFAGD